MACIASCGLNNRLRLPKPQFTQKSIEHLTMTNLTRFAWLSITAAIVTITLKGVAYLLTGSVGLLSDALESVVNLVAAVIALSALIIAVRPPDREHAFGHTKVEYFSSGIEGGLILLAAASIGWTAFERLLRPQPIHQLGEGLTISILASAVNLGVSLVLSRAAKRFNSITLEADAKHLMTDVWTSVGVVAGVGAVALTGWQRLDPLIAIAVALNIVWSGVQLLRRSAGGLMDIALPENEQQTVLGVLERYRQRGIDFHAFRTRQAGARRFVSLHVLVPGQWSVLQGHQLLEQLEADIRHALPGTNVATHLEPKEDPTADKDVELDRNEE